MPRNATGSAGSACLPGQGRLPLPGSPASDLENLVQKLQYVLPVAREPVGSSSTSCSGVASALQSESIRRASDSASRIVCAGTSAESPILKTARSRASHSWRRTGSIAGGSAPPSAAMPRMSGDSSSTSPIGSIRGSRLAPGPLISRKAALRASAHGGKAPERSPQPGFAALRRARQVQLQASLQTECRLGSSGCDPRQGPGQSFRQYRSKGGTDEIGRRPSVSSAPQMPLAAPRKPVASAHRRTLRRCAGQAQPRRFWFNREPKSLPRQQDQDATPIRSGRSRRRTRPQYRAQAHPRERQDGRGRNASAALRCPARRSARA